MKGWAEGKCCCRYRLLTDPRIPGFGVLKVSPGGCPNKLWDKQHLAIATALDALPKKSYCDAVECESTCFVPVSYVILAVK